MSKSDAYCNSRTERYQENAYKSSRAGIYQGIWEALLDPFTAALPFGGGETLDIRVGRKRSHSGHKTLGVKSRMYVRRFL